MWPFKKKTKIQKAFKLNGNDVNKFWQKVEFCFRGLNKMMLEELAPTFSENSGVLYNTANNKLQINISNDNSYAVMCVAEMQFFTLFVFKETFIQMFPDLSPEDLLRLNKIVNCDIDIAIDLDDKILSKRYDEYLSLSDDSVIVGYSKGELIGNNKNKIDKFEFLRRKAAFMFSDIIWIQSVHKKFLSLNDCLSMAKEFNLNEYQHLDNAKKARGALTFSQLVYKALKEFIYEK